MRRNSRGRRRLDQVLAVAGAAVAAGALAGVKFVGGWAQFLVICLLAAGTGLGAYSGNSLRARAAGTPPQVLISHPHGDEPWAHWLAWRLRRIGYLTSTRPWAPAEHLFPPPPEVAPDHELVIVSRALDDVDHSAEHTRVARARGRSVLALVTAHHDPPLTRWAGCEVLTLAGRTADDAAATIDARLHQAGAVPLPEYTASHVVGEVEPRYPALGPLVTNFDRRAVSHFAARREELALLRAVLGTVNASGGGRTCAIHGLSGIGKTRLALEYARRYEDLFDVIWRVEAAHAPTARASLLALAHRLQDLRDQQTGPRAPHEDRDPEQTLQHLLSNELPRIRALLIYDGAEDDATIRQLLPDTGHGGQVLITSVNPVWQRSAPHHRIALEAFTAQEAVSFLRNESGIDDEAGLAKIVDRLGRLPLALEPAAASLRDEPDIDAYLQALDLPSQDAPSARPETSPSGAPAWIHSFHQAETRDALAGLLLRLCAFLAPQGIPSYFFEADGQRTDLLPRPLAEGLAQPPRDRRIKDTARNSSLLTGEAKLVMHTQVQAVIREEMPQEEQTFHAAAAVCLVNGWFPEDPERESTWPQCVELLPHARVVLDHCGRLGVVDENTSTLLQSMGEYFRVQGDRTEAERLLMDALRQRENLWGRQNSLVANTLVSLSRLKVLSAELPEARSFAEDALKIRLRLDGDRDPRTLESRMQLGRVLRELGDFDGASEAADQTLLRLRRLSETDPVKIADGLCDLGLVRWRQGRLGEALKLHREALQLLERAPGDGEPARRNRTAFVHQALGLALLDSEDLEGAEHHLRSALEVLECAGYAVSHPIVLSSSVHLGETLRQRAARYRGRDDRRSPARERSSPGEREAERLLAEAKRIFDQVLSAPHMDGDRDHPDRACALVRYSHLLHDQGNTEAALTEVKNAIRIYTEKYGSQHPYVAEARYRRALIRKGSASGGRPPRWREDLVTAREIYLRVHPQDHPLIRRIEEELGDDPGPAPGGSPDERHP
ncbi:tetratricopeptide (TPR) repeat protein [Streptomyces sp. SAI-135]|jgi:tetratricopeptide (TPR) repeat protein|uniref:FxSxx-COOH system tetratricopeptide repeat protein n=1 Tax=unclassified Streptomyces TaxID=2593676 RepID=UPI00247546EA|nr:MULTISPECIES: FxSxx-COOH system tetratricopeptide repeat protein [unclassified Streptomyces]MDH6517464.1 tetratricopeptide (TPR) repeat protein [Streptomyces sp. SAI-090]MDH6568743.1 tetratricopeptide (TPR) repeat protein [Streptomyces sp. SAI-117]MDH6618447.1 tetratricopeptide (TPR) repeat protein [Streptomyces sp. SAI-135]